MTTIAPSKQFDRFNWRFAYGIGAALVLLAPAIAMQLTPEVNWGASDFAVGALLLGLLGLGLDLAVRAPRHLRFALAGLAVVAVIAIWTELAVGIFGTPLAGN